ncbi:asparagine synthetase [Mucor velutinosus]|uniref:Asparagine synthetase n=1 Tax=Mucor velutinosus TaxID=708070 RepID=A0AAN7I2S8_9FUNG|nr:asparagine synthetase [Mucor velutinosus]
MSDIKTAHNTRETELSDGTTVYINGEPYYIGRVMEFCTSHKRKGLQVRIAWYNRMKDIINRKTADSCLLVATMHSDIYPVSSIRGKCTVMHKHYVPNIDVYRKQQDHFYYNQLYDRYIQRVYDVVPCETVQNVPMDTLEALKSRYQFIAVEQGKAADLTVARRICCVCQQWCQSAMSVKCAACHKSFHMSCLNPPLARKPSKGFAWQCAYCTRQEQLAESNPESPVTSVTSHTRSSSKASSPETSDSQQQTTKELSIAAATAAVVATKTELKRQMRATRSQVKQQQQQETLLLNAMVAEDASANSFNTSSPNCSRKSNPTIKREGPQAQHMNMTNMWPFRYFGVNTAITDILDVDDRIYPRAKSRIGTKYQANVPDFVPPSRQSRHSSSTPAASRSPRGLWPEEGSVNKEAQNVLDHQTPTKDTSDQDDMASPFSGSSDLTSSMRPTRGTDDTVTVIYRPGILNELTIDHYVDSVKKLKNIPLPPHNSDLMDRALYELELNNYDTETAYDNMSKLNGDDFKHVVEWTPAEMEAFEQSIRDHGHDLNYAKAAVKTKDMADIVRYFYQWKKTDRYEPVYSEWTKVYRPLKKFKRFPRDMEREAEEARLEKENEMAVEHGEHTDLTIVPRSTYASRNYQCMNCLTEQSRIWRRSPSDFDRKRKVFSKVLCNDCGVFWLKYAKTKPISPETRIANVTMSSASNNGPLSGGDNKRKRSESHSSSMKQRLNDDQEYLEFNPSSCTICHIMSGPPNSLYTCYSCGMSVHHDCYGVKDKTEHIGWQCDPCQNRKKPVASYNYECVLCYNTTSKHQALKMTSGYCWAHVQCAVFIPEVKFVNPSTLSPVEYIGCVNPARTEAQCSLCDDQRGACIACSECNKTMHVQCAVDNNYRLLFEILPPNAKSHRHQSHCPAIPAGHFSTNSAAGIMVPQVICPSHSLTGKQLVRIEERTANESRKSALYTFCNYFKRISSNSTPAMRRYLASSAYNHTKKMSKKMPSQLDALVDSLTMDASLSSYAGSHESRSRAILTSLSPSSSASSASSRSCSQCPAKFSPIWWSVGSDPYSLQRLCQRCHNKEQLDQQHVH